MSYATTLRAEMWKRTNVTLDAMLDPKWACVCALNWPLLLHTVPRFPRISIYWQSRWERGTAAWAPAPSAQPHYETPTSPVQTTPGHSDPARPSPCPDPVIHGYTRPPPHRIATDTAAKFHGAAHHRRARCCCFSGYCTDWSIFSECVCWCWYRFMNYTVSHTALIDQPFQSVFY